MIYRLFVGTFIDYALIARAYGELKSRLGAKCSAKWVEPENLHFTYFFLGDVESGLAGRIANDLKGITGIYEFSLELRGLSAFPDRRNPRILYMGIYNSDGIIIKKQKEMESVLGKHGFEAEKRKFKPHLTLARIKSSEREFGSMIEEYSERDFGKMSGFSIDLINSKLTSGGPIYSKFE
jgi:RNA 2',3'-cyclic 3'-phosphodiesterase